MAQTSYSQYQSAAFAGMLADLSRKDDPLSFAAESAVGFGKFVKRGTSPDAEVNPLSTSVGQAALAIGVAVATQTVEQTSGGVAQYAATDTVPVLNSGRIWLETDDAVVAGAVANLKLSSGKVTDEAVGAGIEAFTQFSARFLTGTSAAGLAIVEIK
jgi:hypothetical protein